MFEEREAQVAEAVERENGRRLAACREVLGYTTGLIEPWSGRPIEKAHDGIMGALLARSIKTFAAFPHLARNGYGEQASMLNRSLFEDMVDAHWASLNPELAVERYGQHGRHGSMLFAEELRKHPTFFEPTELPEFDEAERKELDDIFGLYGHKSWTCINLHDRVAAIEGCWTKDEGGIDEEAVSNLRFFRDIVHQINNRLLHVTSYALSQTLKERAADAETLSYKLGPSNDHIDQAIFGAYWMFVQTASLMIEFFKLDDPKVLEKMIREGMAVFVTLQPDDLREVGRNDPCPCGSGLKFKKCHGR
jgi:SEC-C motif/Family of unknown function (DUF5677)